MSVQKIPYEGERVEGPAVQFGEDWPGLFLRGDHCIAVAMALQTIENLVIEKLPGEMKEIDVNLALALIRGVRKDIQDQVLIR